MVVAAGLIEMVYIFTDVEPFPKPALSLPQIGDYVTG